MRHHAPPPRLVSGRRVAVVFLSRLDAQHAHTLKPQTASMKQQRWNSTNNDMWHRSVWRIKEFNANFNHDKP